jgi:hypothetical protein
LYASRLHRVNSDLLSNIALSTFLAKPCLRHWRKTKLVWMEPYLAYFQSNREEFFARVVNIHVSPDGNYQVHFFDGNGSLQTAMLPEYKITAINQANELHFEERPGSI